MLIEERANENRGMTVVLPYFKQRAASTFMRFKHYKRKWFYNLLGKGLTQEMNGRGGSI